MIEIDDSREKINASFLNPKKIMTSGLVTVEKVQVLQYGPGDKT